PQKSDIEPLIAKASKTLDVLVDPKYKQYLSERTNPPLRDGVPKFDGGLLWYYFVKAAADDPDIVRHYMEVRRRTESGEVMHPLQRAGIFLDGELKGCAFNINPRTGFMLVEDMGTGHNDILRQKGVDEAHFPFFLPGAAVKDSEDPRRVILKITGGFDQMLEANKSDNAKLVAGQFLRIGFSPALGLKIFTGNEEPVDSTIGDIAERGITQGTPRRSVTAKKITSLGDIGERGYLVLDLKGNMFCLQGGSVIEATYAKGVDNVFKYAYWTREGEKVVVTNVKAKHFDTSSDAKGMGVRLGEIIGAKNVAVKADEWHRGA
ncbi:MAG: hypothetical protein KKD39_05585, partial [Candidatus Altiarchaeota archaeon]|nr:hypothetical protein [Candidatus Altiarchaeota archaeon]